MTQHGIEQPLDIEHLIGHHWRPLGYDVADIWMISGLTGCGYGDGEKKALWDEYGRRLNMHGLFDDINLAQAYRINRNSHVIEHAPFGVFGIWANENRSKKNNEKETFGVKPSNTN